MKWKTVIVVVLLLIGSWVHWKRSYVDTKKAIAKRKEAKAKRFRYGQGHKAVSPVEAYQDINKRVMEQRKK